MRRQVRGRPKETLLSRGGEGWQVGRQKVDTLAGGRVGPIGGRRMAREATVGETSSRRICWEGWTTVGAMAGGMAAWRELEAGSEIGQGFCNSGSD